MNGSRRRLLFQGAAALTLAGFGQRAVGVMAAQDEPVSQDNEAMFQRLELLEALEAGGSLWTATSPSTRTGDTFSLSLTNRSASQLSILISTIIMDHQAHHNETAIKEQFELAAGDSRTFEAINAYGQANHFSTRMIAGTGETADLGVEAIIVDASGVQTTSFNERAFWIKSAEDIQAAREARRRDHEEEGANSGH